MASDDSLHAWFQSRQAKKCVGSAWSLDADGVQLTVSRLRGALGEGHTVTFSTVQVLLCEVRQAVNK